MGPLFHRIAKFLGIATATTYSYPALDVTLPGERHLHLVGSIHMGTEGMFPLPHELLNKLNQADALIVEADITEAASPFSNENLAEPLIDRLSEEHYQQLLQRCEELNNDPLSMAFLPAWQVALMLQARQAQRLGLRGEYGIDYQLLKAAAAQKKTVIELEGAQMQLDLLETLPDNGMSLLLDTLAHWHTNARLLQTMMSWWLEHHPINDLSTLAPTFSQGLYDVLMIQRNKRWQQQLEQLPAGRYVVAVGALHLYGEGNLPELLKPNLQ
ncbi:MULTISPECIES: TraB/GumN family protein [Yersinia]|uniref:Conjugal transfer protein TraB n=1 Tax=Yersinia rochesterensis TaxID=1604335 RepID=A0A386HFY0_9GAMM|nr:MULTISPECIES: TraB/GumN family protein [Yersinia]AJI85847.1 utp13 specific WD40 associated domain protein [Yersinia frederiksenii Y225]CNG87388.1 putative ligase [Yersinia kristensenii]AJJ34372.1 utp13 specific WD40 associated domain protein [Yersinia rochesterensis]AYD44742.1 conjugal transfer protein TraB [Yersinia rochesterensis]MDA5544415.1 TraB/GumN family protein [Yersinia rochesterensis]